MDYSNAGFILATSGTNAGEFICIYALADSSVTFTGKGSTPPATNLSIPVRGKIVGKFSSITVNSGSVVLYRGR